MKKIVLIIFFACIPMSNFATEFYVSSSMGDDANDGLTVQSAWKTISKVNSMMVKFEPGDIISFNRGDRFVERLYINDLNGSESNRIKFTSYGTGAKPIIDVTREYTGIWTSLGNNIWKSTSGAYPSVNKRVMIDGKEVLSSKIQTELGTSIPDLVEAFSDDETKTIFIFSEIDPNQKSILHSGLSRAIYLRTSSNIDVLGIEVRGGHYHGITISKCENITIDNATIGQMNNTGITVVGDENTHCSNIVVKNCLIDSNYRFDYRETPNRNERDAEHRGMSDAIRFYDCIVGEISNNTIIDAGHASISLTADDNSFSEISEIKVFNNHCQLTEKRDYGGGITLDRNTFNVEVYNNFVDATKSSQINGHDNHAHHNIFKDIKQPLMYDYPEGYGLDLATYAGEVYGNIIENNVFDNCGSGGIRFRASGTRLFDNMVRNNIIYNCGAENNNIGIEIKYGSSIFDNNFFNNIIYNENTKNVFFDGGTDKYYTVAQFNSYSVYGENADNLSLNPLFNGKNDYHLKDNSPAIDNGTESKSTKDFEGNSIPNNGTLPDIGAYEYYDTTTGSVKADAGEDQIICQGGSATLSANGGSIYLWNNGATTQSIIVSPEDTSIYSVIVSDGSNSDEDSVEVFVNNVIANAGSDITIQEGQSITLTASGGDSYAWSTGATTKSITVSPDSTTNHTVTVTKNGCEDTDSVLVTVNSSAGPLTANAGRDEFICLGDTVLLTANGGSTYLWNNGATTQSITVSPTETTNYSVTVKEDLLTDTDSVLVTVNSLTASAGSNKTISQGESITLTASGGDSYLWSTGETTKIINVTPQETRSYAVTVYKNGCVDISNVQVIVDPNEIDSSEEKLDSGNDISELDNFKVYPNPSINGSVNIMANVEYDAINLSISSTNGSVVYFETVKTVNNIAKKAIDISKLTKGIYIFSLYNSDFYKAKKVVVL